MATPVITPLPSPPVPTDAPATFATKAGASVTAQAAMVPELNAAFVWQAASQAATLSYQTAAASSATAADGSATTAAAQVVLAAAQVGLAATQANNAAASATSAQTAAAAAGAAAGLPSFTGKDALDVLQINSAKNGVQWGKAGQSVGDILVTARAPGATYAQANRVSYLQSLYPDLFALIGALPNIDQATATQAVISASFPSDTLQVITANDTGSLIIAVVAAQAFLYTSTDYGATWTRRAGPTGSALDLAYNNGAFVLTSNANTNIVYRSTDGITWTSVGLAQSQSGARIQVINGLFVVQPPTASAYSTSPDGITWTARAAKPSGVTSLCTAGSYIFGLSATQVYYTSDGITWGSMTSRDVNGAAIALADIKYLNGTYYATVDSDTTLYKTTTPVAGNGWGKVPNVFIDSGGTPRNTFTQAVQGGVSITGDAIVFGQAGAGYWAGTDNGTTWTYKTSAVGIGTRFTVLPDRFIFPASAGLLGSLPYRSYDKTINFITPKTPAVLSPLQTYIKGKLV